jgi:DNA-binding CsgD family transcriptional regulator
MEGWPVGMAGVEIFHRDGAMFSVGEFSDAVLDLQSLAQAKAIDDFQQAALERVQPLVGFDKAWWGIMSPASGSFALHSSQPFNLDDGFVPLWEETKYDDALAKAVKAKPRETVYFDQRRFNEAPGLAILMGEHGVGQAFCTSVYLPSETAFVFLSLYRTVGDARFTRGDQQMAQYLMPHLCSAWTSNRIFQMEYLKASMANDQVAMAILDRQGQLLNAEPQFVEALRCEWPDIGDGCLPDTIGLWLKTDDFRLKLRTVVLQRHLLGDFTLLVVRGRSRLDVLTPRETAVAEAFGRGSSYKEIARQLDLAPATIRFYLRAIYEKLGVSDKGELASLLRQEELHIDGATLAVRYRQLHQARFI